MDESIPPSREKHKPLFTAEGEDLHLPKTKQKERWLERLRSVPLWANLLFTLIVAVATSLQSCFTIRYTDYARQQLKAINDSSKDTQGLLHLYKQQADALDRLAHAAEDQAASAKKTVDLTSDVAVASGKTALAADASTKLAKQSLILSNAPLLTVVEVALTHPIKAGEKVELTYRLHNAGRGPAYRLAPAFSIGFSPSRVNDRFLFTFTPSADVSEMELEPGRGSSNVVTLPDIISPAYLALIEQGKAVLDFYAIAIYDDSFGQHYRVEMCNEYDYDPTGRKLGLEYCHSHNDPPLIIKSRPW